MNSSIDNPLITRSENLERVINYNAKSEVSVKTKNSIKRSHRQIKTEVVFRRTLSVIGWLMIALVIGILLTLIWQSMPSIKKYGFSYVWTQVWNPTASVVNPEVFGALPFLFGTLLTSFLALLISIPFSLAVAIFLGEYYPEGWFSNLLMNTVELIASIPSVIYGFWGLAVIIPILGKSIMTSSLILAVMIIPYAASLGRSMIRMVPANLKEAAYSLGSTRYEVIRSVIIPYVKSGLFAGVLLSLGRALGETMAVTMVIGNNNSFPKSIFSTGNTLASMIALELPEATDDTHISALVELGLILFVVTVVINLIGRKIISRYSNV